MNINKHGLGETERMDRNISIREKLEKKKKDRVRKELLLANPWLVKEKYQILFNNQSVRIKNNLYDFSSVRTGTMEAFALDMA